MSKEIRILIGIINEEIIRIERKTSEIAKLADAAKLPAQAVMVEAKAYKVEAKASFGIAEASREFVMITKNALSKL